MTDRYFSKASELMELSNLCTHEEAASILMDASLKISELAESHGAIIKRAEEEIKAAE